MEGELWSNCCGAAAGEYEDVGICPACKEHCEFETDEDEGNE
jgi:hypothetical protein